MIIVSGFLSCFDYVVLDELEMQDLFIDNE